MGQTGVVTRFAAADALAIVAFVVLGRRAHDEGTLLTGTLAVAWPFLIGAASAWAAMLAARRPDPVSLRGGLVVVAATVVIGMALRGLTGGGVEVSFVLVATSFLALFLLGWREIVRRRAGARVAG